MTYTPNNYVVARNSLPLLETRAEFWARHASNAEGVDHAPRLGKLWKNAR